MAQILPFRGVLYNVSKVSVEDVFAPPYDIITPEFREELYKRSPYNIVRIDFGKEDPNDSKTENKYTRARRYLDEWLNGQILVKSERPSFYVYEMSYKVNGQQKRLLGFLGLVKLEELGKGGIYPHECTYSVPKQDRLNLLRSCEANISPIFSLYKSYEKGVHSILSNVSATKIPYISVKDEAGAVHKIWSVDEKEKIELIQKELKDKAIFIADGHHRYETAFEFHKELHKNTNYGKDEQPFDYVMMFLVNMMDEGITILPTHRLVRKIPDNINAIFSRYFHVESIDDFDIRKKLSNKRGVFGFFKNNDEKWYILKYKGGDLSEISPELRDIDVFILHELIFKNMFKDSEISYEMDIQIALNKVRSGEFGAVFFLNPTKVEDVEKAALSSTRMPPKSTYFYPKLLTGLVIYKW